ncbi:MAG: zinc transporter ZupT [Promethearchaeati archaeon]
MATIESIGYAFILTFIAGLSTGIGSLIAYFIRKPKMKYLTFGLGFSAGVMIYISFVELLPRGFNDWGEIQASIAFFLGIFFIFIIDLLIPEIENPHHPVNEDILISNRKMSIEEKGENKKQETGYEKKVKDGLLKSGMLTALAIAIHNFPEGLATFAGSLGDIKVGLAIAVAIAVHNIPEGVSISIPIFYATNNRKKAFIWSFLSGLTEPIGALIGFLILRPFMTPELLGGILAFISGIMVYISLDEILPTAHHYGHGHVAIIGVVLGMIVMALSLILL